MSTNKNYESKFTLQNSTCRFEKTDQFQVSVFFDAIIDKFR